MPELPVQQQAAVRQGTGQDARAPITLIDVPTPAPGQLLVHIKWTGVCATDKCLLRDEWSSLGIRITPAAKGIAGHEGVGVVAAIGEGMDRKWKVGDRAGIKWIASICKDCEFCKTSEDEVNCPTKLCSGFTTPGTFQEYCLTDGQYATKIPDGVTDEEAGPLMCGGLTAYVACKRSTVKPGQWIVVMGAGGGLGHFAVQYAKAMGMRVIAIDTGATKKDLCLQLGAEHFLDFMTTPDLPAVVLRFTKYGAHGIIVTAATQQAYESAPKMLRAGGTAVSVGLPADASVVAGAPPSVLAVRRLRIVGSNVGSAKDVEEALDFTVRGLVHPILTKRELKDLDEVLDLMKAGKLAGRAILRVS